MTPEQFFAAEAGRPCVWGKSECAHTADRWLELASGRSAIRGSGYDFADEAEGEALLARLPLPLMVARVMRRAGFRMTDSPRRGDIGVLAFPDQEGGTMIVCAVKGASMWLYRSTRGVSSAGRFARVVGAWRVAE